MICRHGVPYHLRKLSSAEQMREFDRLATERYGVPSIVLMENAGRLVHDAVHTILTSVAKKRIVVIAGKGNNGGDGFVAARHLRDAGADVCVYILSDADTIKGDAKVNLDILNKTGFFISTITAVRDIEEDLNKCDALVDAVYGTGLNGDITGLPADVINAVNQCRKPVISVDIPSGVDAETGQIHGVSVQADVTATFALPKLGLFLYPGAGHTGFVIAGDIGIPHELFSNIKVEITTPEFVANCLPLRSVAAHKGIFGTTAVIAGSKGMTGAGALASEAVLRTGAGLSILCVPASLQNAMAIKLTEVMTRGLPETPDGMLSTSAVSDALRICEKASAVVLGCGLGVSEDTFKFIDEFIKSTKIPIVIDADGLNCISQYGEKSKKFRDNIVITPHPTEMARLLGTTTAEIQSDRLGAAKKASQQFGCVVVLKGAGTVIASFDEHAFINTTGNPGMATGGTGDVLAGVIGGLMSQGLSAFDAAVSGVFIHGMAGDIAADEIGESGMIAGDLLVAVPKALCELYSLKCSI
ncbi:MAG: NAD(P)H-hydrate dehydratase [Armatimonadota bacterium]